MSHLPLQFASLEIEANETGATGNPASAFFIGAQVKKEANKSAQPRPPLTPFKRGEQTCKQRGELAETTSCTRPQTWDLASPSPTRLVLLSIRMQAGRPLRTLARSLASNGPRWRSKLATRVTNPYARPTPGPERIHTPPGWPKTRQVTSLRRWGRESVFNQTAAAAKVEWDRPQQPRSGGRMQPTA